MGDMRPTDSAAANFQWAAEDARRATNEFSLRNDLTLSYLAHAVQLTANGLRDLATGLRDTYGKLEEIQRSMSASRPPGL